MSVHIFIHQMFAPWPEFSLVLSVLSNKKWDGVSTSRILMPCEYRRICYRINIMISRMYDRASACISPRRDAVIGLTSYGEAHLYSLEDHALSRKLRTGGLEGPFRPLKSCLFYDADSVAFAFANTPALLLMPISRPGRSKVVQLARTRGRSWAPNASGMYMYHDQSQVLLVLTIWWLSWSLFPF